MSLVLDGGESMPFNVPSTGGWQSWSSLSLGQVNITSGVKDLRVKILTAGFNFSSLTFTLVTAAEDDTAPRTVEVSAAYPNPFNPETRINVTLPSERRVVMAVTDMLGRVVHRADEGLRSAGTHAITWNAARMPSGVYFYTCEVRPASGLEAPTVRSGRIVLTK